MIILNNTTKCRRTLLILDQRQHGDKTYDLYNSSHVLLTTIVNTSLHEIDTLILMYFLGPANLDILILRMILCFSRLDHDLDKYEMFNETIIRIITDN